MLTRTFDVYADPGHAWVKVKLSDLLKLDIHDKITNFSYLRGEYAYLEEDCDATTLVKALKANEVKFGFREHTADKRSKIRGYQDYSTANVDWQDCRAL